MNRLKTGFVDYMGIFKCKFSKEFKVQAPSPLAIRPWFKHYLHSCSWPTMRTKNTIFRQILDVISYYCKIKGEVRARVPSPSQ